MSQCSGGSFTLIAKTIQGRKRVSSVRYVRGRAGDMRLALLATGSTHYKLQERGARWDLFGS
ncbi:hypothetical protein MN608_04087 [Microdochium nivale]|nr:hypothetical protein MN608_04087 [Microdochium nivale]